MEGTGDKRVTLATVAKLAGVSKQTVSRVINNSDHVTQETRERVLQCIDVLGFRPSALARQLSSGRSQTLGVVSCGRLGYLSTGAAYIGMVRLADKMGYALLIKELVDFSPSSVRAMLDYLIERQVDGLIWAGPEIGDSHSWMDQVDQQELPMPLVVVNAQQRSNIDTVAYDNRLAGRNVTRALIEMGCRNIGHIAGPTERWVARERLAGWQDELRASGLEHCLPWTVEGDWEARAGAEGLATLLERAPKLDAVFAGNDHMAYGVLYEAHRRGIRIPEDLAVIGVDDLPESAYMIPPLTTLVQDTPEMAERALRLLVRRICERRGDAYPELCAEPVDCSLVHKLVPRESTR